MKFQKFYLKGSMKIEILTIGSELLRGEILDGNFQQIARKLFQQGWECFWHTSVADHPDEIKRAVDEALQRVEVLIVTGGLGPTCDDHTKSVFSSLFKMRLITSQEIKKNLIERYGPELSSLENQALVLEGAQILKNPVGTAPGFYWMMKDKTIIILPGPPCEMLPMLENEVIPKLALEKKQKDIFKKELNFCLLSENEINPYLEELKKNTSLNIGIYPSRAIAKVFLSCTSIQDCSQLEQAEKILENHLGSYIFSYSGETLSQALHRLFTKKKWTLAVAESCTGGQIASTLVTTAGASDYFLGAVVAYANEVKKNILNVKEETLKTYGAVSEQVIQEMLEGLKEISRADVVLAVSGVAGPTGGTSEKPVGTVYCGFKILNEPPCIWKIQAKGSHKRDFVINYSTHFCLGALYRYIMYQKKPLK